MRNFRKMIAAFSMVAILSTLVVSTAFAGTYTDVPENSSYYSAVEALATAGVLDTTKTTFGGTVQLKRAEAVKLAVLAAGYDLESPANPTFTDVSPTAWYYSYVETAAAHGVIDGTKGEFHPDNNLNRAQYAKMLVVANLLPETTPVEPTFKDVPATHWSYTYVETAYAWTVLGGYGDGTFKPANPVTRYQAAAMTNSAMNPVSRDGGTVVGDDDDDDSGVLEGGAGNLDDADFISSLKDEDVTEGDEDVEVAGLTLTADEGSDLEVTAVRLAFAHTGAAGHDDLEDYATEVSVYFEGEEVARVDASEFNDDNDYTKTVSLDEGAIIPADDEGDLVVALTAGDVIDSNDTANANNDWTVAFASVRYADAAGAIITETTTGDIGVADTRDFEFVAAETGEDIELKSSSSNPDAMTILVDDENVSDEYDVFQFGLKGKENDIEVKKLELTVTTKAADHFEDVVNDMSITIDGEEFTDYDVTHANTNVATVTFNIDKDYTIAADTTVQVVVSMDFQKSGTYTPGTSTVKVSTAEVTGKGVDDVVDTSTINGEVHTLSLSVPVVKNVTTTSTKSEDNTVGYISFEFDVTAESDDVVFGIADKAAVNGVTDDVTFDVTGKTPGIAVTAITLLDGDATWNNTAKTYTIAEGDTATFALDTTLDTSAVTTDAGTYRVKLQTVAGTTLDKISNPVNLVD